MRRQSAGAGTLCRPQCHGNQMCGCFGVWWVTNTSRVVNPSHYINSLSGCCGSGRRGWQTNTRWAWTQSAVCLSIFFFSFQILRPALFIPLPSHLFSKPQNISLYMTVCLSISTLTLPLSFITHCGTLTYAWSTSDREQVFFFFFLTVPCCALAYISA